jgi:DNA-binding XRE family transcriptional regulator
MTPKTKYISAEALFAELGYDPNEKETKIRLEKLQAKVDAVLLSDLRKAAALTQTEMAVKLDVSQNRISQIELADLEAMQLSTIRNYVEALGGQLVFGAIIKNKIVAIRESAPKKVK